jgi:hypothetical protein
MKSNGNTIHTFSSLSSLVPTTTSNMPPATKTKKRVEMNEIVIDDMVILTVMMQFKNEKKRRLQKQMIKDENFMSRMESSETGTIEKLASVQMALMETLKERLE